MRLPHRVEGNVVACIRVVPLVIPALLMAALATLTPARVAAQSAGPGPAYVEEIPGTLVSFGMVPVPGGSVTVNTSEGSRTIVVAPFWIAKTETTWDLYDVFVYNLDRGAATSGVDAVSRPSRPYVLPGDAFGHKGLPALGMSLHAAREFANWVSVVTGRTYRVPTEAQWRHACSLGIGSVDPAARAELAWTASNAGDRTRAVGTREPDALGLNDMLGNVAEWTVPIDGDSAVLGGAWDDAAADVACTSRRPQTRAWNETDPQLPKSRWWLTDAPFLGVRLIRIPDDSTTNRGTVR